MPGEESIEFEGSVTLLSPLKSFPSLDVHEVEFGWLVAVMIGRMSDLTSPRRSRPPLVPYA